MGLWGFPSLRSMALSMVQHNTWIKRPLYLEQTGKWLPCIQALSRLPSHPYVADSSPAQHTDLEVRKKQSSKAEKGNRKNDKPAK